MTKILTFLTEVGKMLLMLSPFLVLTWLNAKANLKRKERYKQFLMPVLALVFCVIAIAMLNKVYLLSQQFLDKLPFWLAGFADWLLTMPKWIHFLGNAIGSLAVSVAKLFKTLDLGYIAFYVANALLLLGYVIIKRILVTVLKLIFKEDNAVFLFFANLFYELDETNGYWYLKNNWGQARTFTKVFYVMSAILGAVAVMVSAKLYQKGMMTAPYYPVFGVIIVGEIWFFLNGLTRGELRRELTGEDDDADRICDYSGMRKVLRALFPDRLAAENTTVSDPLSTVGTTDELLQQLEESGTPMLESYGTFMRRKHEGGMELDRNYLHSGRQLLCGQSILFNNPFYYDLIPYIFYPMNRTLLRHKKVLIILGRHGNRETAATWCEDGLRAVTNVPDMWNIGVLSQDSRELDVGIVTRSGVHDLQLHENNRDFFDEVEFVVILEPSRLMTTAQVGLNSLVRHCRRRKKQLVFCSTDKNCDGLLDALSHMLMTSLSEVAATNHHKGASSYMIWEADNAHLQHRMLPNLSRYLGMGTELSFAALKNQVTQTQWFGGDAFPVVDIHWIVRQYYYDLLGYAGLPAEQELIDKQFRVSADMWSARADKNQYITVEDESFNMFEVKRDFSTRATDQGFVNVITSEYLLKDYMSDNNSIFDADPKAIPYITADYARSNRNVVLRLCLRMCSGLVPESDIHRELLLIERDGKDPVRNLWLEVCASCGHIGTTEKDRDDRVLLVCHTPEGKVSFNSDVIIPKRRFNVDTGLMETMYRINDGRFIKLVLGGLSSVEYIAEDENGQRQYLGTELQGQVFQKYLPGQFFTFGGKYYEMLRVTSEGQVLVRRAADHIEGRPFYRQERRYFLRNAVDSTVMGHCRDMGVMRLIRQNADIRVETPAYWAMDRYNDFSTARRIGINGVPDRVYNNKSILRLDLLPDSPVDSRTLQTLALLINETLRTLLAENQDYLVALTPGQVQIPATYSLEGEGDFCPGISSIYLVEDCQLDIGLLDAVERNLDRILAIVCDYLSWHRDALGMAPVSMDAPVIVQEGYSPVKEKPKSWIGRAIAKVGGFFKGIGRGIKSFFGKLFGKKKSVQAVQLPMEPDAEPVAGVVTEPVVEPAAEPAPVVEMAAEPVDENVTQPVEEAISEDTEPMEEAVSEDVTEVAEESEPETEETEQSRAEPEEEITFHFNAGENTVSYEPEKVTATETDTQLRRADYRERCYLRYGDEAVSAWLDLWGVSSLLQTLGYGNSALEQARKGKDIAAMVERTFVPNQRGAQYCDFCGCELSGMEYEVLADGRERCGSCGRTAIRSLEEFTALHDSVLRNLKLFFGVKINAPVRVQMVNSKKLHKKLGKSFVPTGSFDGRILGVAIRSRDGYSILVENGAPKLQAAMTLVHEMTHIWQYLNWDARQITQTYGTDMELEVYEGMSKWVEIQYAYLLGETAAAKREEIVTRYRQDAYGKGFLKYAEKYPLTTGPLGGRATPFDNLKDPL